MRLNKDRSNLTVMIVPHGKSQTHSFQLSQKVIKGVAILLALLVTGLLYLLVDYVILQRHTDQLVREREAMQQQIALLEESLQQERTELLTLVEEVAAMEQYLQQLEQLESEILNKAGSITLPSEETSNIHSHLGLGGPERLSGQSRQPELFDNPAIMRKQTAQTLSLLSVKFPDTVKKVTDLRDKVEEINEQLAHTPSIYPAIGVITSRFGYRRDPFHGRTRFHDGFDIAGHYGAPVYATAAGKVVFASRNGGHGLMVKIAHSDTLHTSYSHLSRMIVKPGDEVEKGEVIGYMGSTGRSTGVHVHYMVYEKGVPVDPEKYLPNERGS